MVVTVNELVNRFAVAAVLTFTSSVMPYHPAGASDAQEEEVEESIAPSSVVSAPESTPEALVSSFMIVNRRIDDFLEDLSRENNIRITRSDSVRGRIVNTVLTGTTYEVLDTISKRYSLDWFEYNNVFYLSHKSEAVTRMIRLGDLSFKDTLVALKDSALPVERYPFAATSEDAVLSVTGPPYMIAIVESIIEGIPTATENPRNAVRVRRGLAVHYEAIN